MSAAPCATAWGQALNVAALAAVVAVACAASIRIARRCERGRLPRATVIRAALALMLLGLGGSVAVYALVAVWAPRVLHYTGAAPMVAVLVIGYGSGAIALHAGLAELPERNQKRRGDQRH